MTRTAMLRRLSEMKSLKLVVFDVDETIMKAHSWQFLHEALGTWDKSHKYFEMFFGKRITYEEWAQLDASLWRGLPLERVKQIVNTMPYAYGAKETISALKRKGFRVFLLSAGLSLVAERINKEIGVDGYLANDLIAKNGLLTGGVKVNVSFYNKEKVLSGLLVTWKLKMEDCVAIGDDPTLIPLFEKVGFSIAFNPVNEAVAEKAKVVVKSDDMRNVLPYIAAEQRSDCARKKSD